MQSRAHDYICNTTGLVTNDGMAWLPMMAWTIKKKSITKGK